MKEKIEHIIDEALKTEPSFQLRKDFKDRVIKAIKRQEKANQRRLYFWLALGTLAIIGFGYGTIAYFMPTVLESFNVSNDGISKLIPLAVLIGVLTVLVQYLDNRLIKNKLVV